MENKLEKILDTGGTLFIEKEIGAENKLQEYKGKLDDYNLYETISDKNKNIFEKALPDEYSKIFKIKKPPKIISAYFINSNGLLMNEVNRESNDLDGDIFSGMLNAVNNFVKDSLNQKEDGDIEGGLNILSYKDQNIGETTIQMNRGKNGMLVVTYKGNVSEYLGEELNIFNNEIHKKYPQLKEFEGDMDDEYIKDMDKDIKNRFFDSKRFEGEIDLNRLKIAKNSIKEKVLDIVEKEQKNNKTCLLFDEVQNIDNFSAEILDYVSRNSDVPMICQYEIEVLDEGIKNESLQKAMNKITEDNYSKIYIKSNLNIEELVKEKLKDVNEEAFEVLRYAAVAEKFDIEVLNYAMNIPKERIESIQKNLEEEGILKEKRFSNSRLKERAIENIPDYRKSQIDISIANALIKKNENYPKIAELLIPYIETNEDNRENAVKYSIKSAEQFLQNLNTDKAIEFYHNAIDADKNNQRKMDTLEDVLEIENLTWKSKNLLKEFEKDISELEKIAEEENDINKQAVAKLFDLKLYQSRENFDFQKALKKFEVVKAFAEKIDDKEMLTNSYVLAGLINSKKGRLDEAIYYYKEGFKIAEENNILTEKTKLLINIGRIMRVRNKLNDAEEYYNNALNLAKKLNTTSIIPSIMSNITKVYLEKNEYFIKKSKFQEAEEIKNRTLKIKDEALNWCEKTNDLLNKFRILNNVACILMEYEDGLDISEGFYLNALDIAKKRELKNEEIIINYNLGELNLKKSIKNIEEVKGKLDSDCVDKNFKEEINKHINKIFGDTPERIKKEFPRLFKK